MSDTPQGDGWWQTSDGKWHPPDYDPTTPDSGASQQVPGIDPTAVPPQWSPTGATAPTDVPSPTDVPLTPPVPPYSGSYADAPVQDRPPAAPQAPPEEPFSAPPLFGDPSPAPQDDAGPFSTARPGEFGLPSDPQQSTQPKVVRTSVIPSGDGPSGGGGSGPPRALVWVGVAAAVLVLVVAGWYFLLRDDGSGDATAQDAKSSTEPTVAGETTVSETPTTTVAATTAPLPPKPTIAAGERLPALEFNGSGNSTVNLEPPGPRVATIEYTGTGPFSVTGLDLNGGEVAKFVDADGPYSGSVAVDFYDEQDSRSLSVKADGTWSIRMVPVESLTPLPGAFTGSGDNVVLYSGGVGPVTISHSGSGPFQVSYFEITTRKISTIIDETGPFEGTAELRGPAFVWITADGDWSVTPG